MSFISTALRCQLSLITATIILYHLRFYCRRLACDVFVVPTVWIPVTLTVLPGVVLSNSFDPQV